VIRSNAITGEFEAAVWMTARQRERLHSHGDCLFFDGTSMTNAEAFALFMPHGVDQDGKICSFACALGYYERGEIVTWILQHMDVMAPQWRCCRDEVFADSGLGVEVYKRALLNPPLYVLVCMWHWLSLDATPAVMAVNNIIHSDIIVYIKTKLAVVRCIVCSGAMH